VSFEISAGETVGIIGRNGAGKTTMLKIVARITPPTSGRGETVGRVGSLLEVGTGFHPELTGRENIILSAAIMGMGRQEVLTRFDRIVEFSGVSKFLDTPVNRSASSSSALVLGHKSELVKRYFLD
jgi:lipopolysaccharide transport system ATP-binding protein